MSRDEVMAAALEMSREDRTVLAERLLASLRDSEAPPDEEVESRWVAEAARRLERLRKGEIGTIPGSEVYRQIRQALG